MPDWASIALRYNMMPWCIGVRLGSAARVVRLETVQGCLSMQGSRELTITNTKHTYKESQ